MNWDNNNNNNQGGGWSAPQAPSGNIWAGFEDVETAPARNEYLPAGVRGEVEIVELKVISSQKNNNRPMFVGVVKPTENCTLNNDEIPAGVAWDWVAKADERPYLVAIKSLVMALNPDGDPSTFGQELMDALTGPDQPAKGLKVQCRSEAIVTSRGNDFTKVYWRAV
jgi:hypothetical protein